VPAGLAVPTPTTDDTPRGLDRCTPATRRTWEPLERWPPLWWYCRRSQVEAARS